MSYLRHLTVTEDDGTTVVDEVENVKIEFEDYSYDGVLYIKSSEDKLVNIVDFLGRTRAVDCQGGSHCCD